MIVLAVLGIVAGGVVLATESAQDQSQTRTIAYTIKTLHQTIETFTAMQGSAPDNLDSLVAVNATDCDTANVCAVSGSAQLLASLHPSLAFSLLPTTLSENAKNALVTAGLTRLRYVDDQGNLKKPNCNGGCSISVSAMDGTTPVPIGNLDETHVPNRVFDTPVMSFDTPDMSDKDKRDKRGRGFAHVLMESDPVAVIKNTELTLRAQLHVGSDDVLPVFGIGNHSTLIQDGSVSAGLVGLAGAPTTPNTCKHHYARFIAIYNVGSPFAPKRKAEFVAVLDANGRTLDENLEGYAPPTC